ncbi:hypothetical protein D9756_008873 [Leucocoprinus leucothites]|uniref:Zn(2)-C6 fungal-type domain-containing protein n=1 Tax=Leucocoprinus leucothites TaxID=201217 RepID=A0A8H5FU03_9AGAR|nr:hypothetical protein D9756_008873 [Leucoagaricus leucothites]
MLRGDLLILINTYWLVPNFHTCSHLRSTPSPTMVRTKTIIKREASTTREAKKVFTKDAKPPLTAARNLGVIDLTGSDSEEDNSSDSLPNLPEPIVPRPRKIQQLPADHFRLKTESDVHSEDLETRTPSRGQTLEPESLDPDEYRLQEQIHDILNTINWLPDGADPFSGVNLDESQADDIQFLHDVFHQRQMPTPSSSSERKRSRVESDTEAPGTSRIVKATQFSSVRDRSSGPGSRTCFKPTPTRDRPAPHMTLDDNSEAKIGPGSVTRAKAARIGLQPVVESLDAQQPKRKKTRTETPSSTTSPVEIEVPQVCLRCKKKGTKCIFSISGVSDSKEPSTFMRAPCVECTRSHNRCEWDARKEKALDTNDSGIDHPEPAISQERLKVAEVDLDKMIAKQRKDLENDHRRLESLLAAQIALRFMKENGDSMDTE